MKHDLQQQERYFNAGYETGWRAARETQFAAFVWGVILGIAVAATFAVLVCKA